ncbi:MAG: cytochrome c3 family protein [Desulforhopalus sp.]
MLKKVLVCSVISMFALGGAVISSFATNDKGPAEITMTSSKSAKPKPAQFPHEKHQNMDEITCADCHHGMDNGEMVPYKDGQEIKSCEECHNSEVLAGKTKGKLKLDTLKGAGHGNCLECHKEMAKKDPALKEKGITKCSACHPKN